MKGQMCHLIYILNIEISRFIDTQSSVLSNLNEKYMGSQWNLHIVVVR